MPLIKVVPYGLQRATRRKRYFVIDLVQSRNRAPPIVADAFCSAEARSPPWFKHGVGFNPTTLVDSAG
jgi:hypothetical protein